MSVVDILHFLLVPNGSARRVLDAERAAVLEAQDHERQELLSHVKDNARRIDLLASGVLKDVGEAQKPR